MTTCLVVDDVAVSRFAARSFLEELGINVVEAEDGEGALAALNANAVDVVLLDWHLKKKSGLELLGVIRQQHGDAIKVIVFSGVENQGKASEAMSAGANSFIVKPASKDKLQSEITALGIAL